MSLRFLFLLIALILSGCGGGSDFPPTVSVIKGQTLQFGKPAVIYVGGQYLRQDMVVNTTGCTNPAFRSDSTSNLAVLTCNITAVGDFGVTLKSASGNLLYATTLTVPLPQVAMVTPLGNIIMELQADVVPTTVKNFLSYVSSGYYVSTLIHRVEPGFVIQGGGYTAGMVKKPGQLDPIVLESNKGLSNTRGTVAMARLGDNNSGSPEELSRSENSATSEFYFNLVDNLSLDYQSNAKKGYAVFGNVLQGLDVMDKIASVPTGPYTSSAGQSFLNVPVNDVPITLMLQTK